MMPGDWCAFFGFVGSWPRLIELAAGGRLPNLGKPTVGLHPDRAALSIPRKYALSISSVLNLFWFYGLSSSAGECGAAIRDHRGDAAGRAGLGETGASTLGGAGARVS